MTPLERAKAALRTATDPDRRVDLVMPDRPLGLRMRPSDWETDRAISDRIGEKKTSREKLDLSASHLAAHVEAVFGLSESDEPESLYDDGSEAVLNERLAESFGQDVDSYVNSGVLLMDLIGEDNVEDVFFVHRNWSGHSQLVQVRRLGE